MRYLSLDIEATGLDQDCLIIEFAVVPFDTDSKTVEEALAFSTFVKCPSFEELKPTLNPWVIENNQKLIEKAHKNGLTLEELKLGLKKYLESDSVKEYFNHQKIVLFGKSMSAIDLPFLNRDLGWDFMRAHFHHRQLDLSCVSLGLVDLGLLPKGSDSGSKLMNYLGMGEVAHTALEDAINTAKMYLKLMDMLKK